jgi:hypothetical protein
VKQTWPETKYSSNLEPGRYLCLDLPPDPYIVMMSIEVFPSKKFFPQKETWPEK